MQKHCYMFSSEIPSPKSSDVGALVIPWNNCRNQESRPLQVVGLGYSKEGNSRAQMIRKRGGGDKYRRSEEGKVTVRMSEKSQKDSHYQQST